jgi:hypothetical protein
MTQILTINDGDLIQISDYDKDFPIPKQYVVRILEQPWPKKSAITLNPIDGIGAVLKLGHLKMVSVKGFYTNEDEEKK